MSFSTKQGRYLAQVFKSAILKTTAPPARPEPSLFFLPGLSSRAWHDPSDECFSWIKDVEAHYEPILKEYRELVARADVASDYDVTDSEHQLHDGKWDWYSYILKGKRVDKFREHCPITTVCMECE